MILSGDTFTVGDRIFMSNDRGDVMRLGFIQTTIREVGEPPSVQGADPDALAAEAKTHPQQRFGVDPLDLDPRVFFRIIDSWLEQTVRFAAATHGVRTVKGLMARQIMAALDEAGIGITSATYDIVGLPPITLHRGRHRQALP